VCNTSSNGTRTLQGYLDLYIVSRDRARRRGRRAVSSVYSNTSASRPARARAHPPPPPPSLPLYYYYYYISLSREPQPFSRTPGNIILSCDYRRRTGDDWTMGRRKTVMAGRFAIIFK